MTAPRDNIPSDPLPKSRSRKLPANSNREQQAWGRRHEACGPRAASDGFGRRLGGRRPDPEDLAAKGNDLPWWWWPSFAVAALLVSVLALASRCGGGR